MTRAKLTRKEAMKALKVHLDQWYDEVGVPKKYGRLSISEIEQLFDEEIVEMDDETWAGLMEFKGE